PDLGPLYDRASATTAALGARWRTVLKVVRHIVALQPGFFLHGRASIAPTSRAEAAAALDMHASTLGRAIAGKALLWDGQIHPLELFFQNPVQVAEGAVSAFDMRRRIRALIASENPVHPLADDEIRAQLWKEGVDIARRTVTKYRKCMDIPSSFARRRRKVSGAAETQGENRDK